MTKNKFLEPYKKFYSDRDNEQLELFRLLSDKYKLKKVLYPGSYVHVTASFVFPDVTYVDTDPKAKKFFASEEVIPFIVNKKEYTKKPKVSYHPISYTEDFGGKEKAYDLLISLYAGFISMPCKKYLKKNGILLVNNSHGDAGLANLDSEFKFIGVINRRGQKFIYSDKKLDSYFITKKPQEITKEFLLKQNRGLGYTKSANLYLFRKI